jgi:predicted site-specific integrase-resolvase
MSTAEKINYEPPPFSLSPKKAEAHFSIAAQTIYNWVKEGRLVRDKHYLKVGSRLVIVRDEFIEFLRKESNNDNT